MSFFDLFRRKPKHSVLDAINELMDQNPDLVVSAAVREAEKGIAAVRVQVELQNQEAVRRACETCMRLLEQMAKRAPSFRGEVDIQKARVIIEAGSKVEAARLLDGIVQGSTPVGIPETVTRAEALLHSLRGASMPQPSSAGSKYCSHFYTCAACGHLRLALTVPCESCGGLPNDDSELARSALLGTVFFSPRVLLTYCRKLLNGERLDDDQPLCRAAREFAFTATFAEVRKRLASASHQRSSVVGDVTNCSSCGEDILLSTQETCSCGHVTQLPELLRCIIGTNSILTIIEAGFDPDDTWNSSEVISSLVLLRFYLLAENRLDRKAAGCFASATEGSFAFRSLSRAVEVVNRSGKASVSAASGGPHDEIALAKCLAHELSVMTTRLAGIDPTSA